jgi:hypothetical protein
MGDTNNNNNNNEPPRKKRKWYSQKRNNINNTLPTPPPPPSRQDTLKKSEKERIENDNQVSKMEQQLHQYFHKSKTPYSFIDETGIYKFTPVAPTVPVAPVPNPFMNMTFTPFIPPTPPTPFTGPPPLFSGLPNQSSDLWASIFPNKVVFPPPPPPPPPPVVPETIEINENIQHIDDLIALCDKYPLSETKKYNINMAAIHAIRAPLSDLSNMIGMDTLKQTIVDQILYYLQELHIPENRKPAAEPAVEPFITGADHQINDKNAQFNPFAQPFTASGAGAGAVSADATTKQQLPPLFDFKTLHHRISENIKKSQLSEDNGSSPTKGDFMHTVIYGPPGSGKTEVAKSSAGFSVISAF